jgi:heme exporter protein D
MGEDSGGSRMNFNSFDEFLSMGGYGLYVWSAYGIALVVFAYNIIRPILMRRQVIKEQKQEQKLEHESKNSSEQGSDGLDKRAGELT